MQENYIDKLRSLRETHHDTQQMLASHLGTSQTMYSRYECGKSELPVRFFREICEFYHVSADAILDLTSDPKPDTDLQTVE